MTTKTKPAEAERPDIEEAQARAEKATEGPWELHGEDGLLHICAPNPNSNYPRLAEIVMMLADASDDDMAFISEARTDVLDLCAYALELEDNNRILSVLNEHIPRLAALPPSEGKGANTIAVKGLPDGVPNPITAWRDAMKEEAEKEGGG